MLRKEFTEYISTHSSGEPDGGVAEDQVRSPIRLGIVKIRQRSRTHVAQHIRIIGFGVPVIAAREERGADCVQQARLDRAGALVVMARILMQQRGEDRMSQIVAASSVRELCRKALAVSRGALPVWGKRVVRLLDACRDPHANHRNWIECTARSERKFLLPGERRGVIYVAGIKVRQDTDQTQLFFRSYLFSGDHVRGTYRHLHVRRRKRQ